MHKLNGYIRHFVSLEGRGLACEADSLSVPVGAGGRRQEIRFERQGDAYVMTSIVLARAGEPNGRETARTGSLGMAPQRRVRPRHLCI